MTHTAHPPVPAPLLKKQVLLLIGARAVPESPSTQMPQVGATSKSPKQQTAFVNHHDTVVDILKFVRQPTDGSMLLLEPGTLTPYAMDDQPYHDIANGATIEVVPNRPDQIGPFLTESQRIETETAAVAVQDKPAPVADIGTDSDPVVSGYPKLLRNPAEVAVADAANTVACRSGNFAQPDKLVNNLDEEISARAIGFTVEVPQPKA